MTAPSITIVLGCAIRRLIVDPDRHAYVGQRTYPARLPAGCRLIRDQPNVDTPRCLARTKASTMPEPVVIP
jgi:hypothetical protein